MCLEELIMSDVYVLKSVGRPMCGNHTTHGSPYTFQHIHNNPNICNVEEMFECGGSFVKVILKEWCATFGVTSVIRYQSRSLRWGN